MPALIEEGRAKVNLSLRVVGRRADGYHDLESVVAFADCADRLTLEPGGELKLTTTGPLAAACGDMADNLVFKAAKLLAEAVPNLKLGAFALDKVLPVAAGIGGGSGGAAAAPRPTPRRRCGCCRVSTICRSTTPASRRLRLRPVPTCRRVCSRAPVT